MQRLAQTRVSVPCWPIRASFWNQISIGLPLARSGICAEVFFKHLLGFVSLRVTGPYRQFAVAELARTFPTERSWSATPKRHCNSSRRSTRRHRTTPCIAGSGPASTSSANSACSRNESQSRAVGISEHPPSVVLAFAGSHAPRLAVAARCLGRVEFCSTSDRMNS